MSHRLLVGHVLDKLRELPDCSVQLIVTSPPYWQQRAYGRDIEEKMGGEVRPQIWDDPGDCEHLWGDELPGNSRGGSGTGGNKRTRQIPHGDGRQNDSYADSRVSYADSRVPSPVGFGRDAGKGQFCSKCGAWLGELGQEPTVDLFIRHTVQVFEECRRVLRKDGVLFLNIGDTRGSGAKGANSLPNGELTYRTGNGSTKGMIKEKSLALVPERLLIALDEAGWTVRSKIVWEKPSAMPESATDRPTESWEPVYMLTKSPKYASYFDQVREATTGNAHSRGDGVNPKAADGADGSKQNSSFSSAVRNVLGEEVSQDVALPYGPGNGHIHGRGGHGSRYRECEDEGKPELPDNFKGSLPGRKDGPGQDRRSKKDRTRDKETDRASANLNTNWGAKEAAGEVLPTRNCRNVWRFPNPGTKFLHYAAFPPELPRRCILAATKEGDVVFDPFSGTGTTLAVAVELGRQATGIELFPEYAKMIEKRLESVTGSLFASQDPSKTPQV